MLPQCKPVLALTVLAGAALGGETGFLVGAVTMLVSNILFSQGPWTPWQMLGMGLCGFLAGLVFRRGGLPRKREALCAYGAVSAFLVYGILLNAYAQRLLRAARHGNADVAEPCSLLRLRLFDGCGAGRIHGGFPLVLRRADAR